MPGPAAAILAVGEVSLALNEFKNAIHSFVGQITGFVEAVDPSSVRVMQDALRMLSATVGYSIVPVIQGFTQLVKDVAGEINAPMTALRDVVGALVSDTVSLLQPVISVVGDLLRDVVGGLQNLMPLVRVVTATLVGLAQVGGYLLRVWGALSSAFFGLFTPLGRVGDAADSVARAFTRTVIALMTGTDTILRMIGLAAVANKLLANMGPRGQGRPPAYENVQLGDTMSAYRQRLLEAGRATAGPSLAQQQADYLRQIAENTRALKEKAEKGGGPSMDWRDLWREIVRLDLLIATGGAINWRPPKAPLRNDNEAPDKGPPPGRGGG